MQRLGAAKGHREEMAAFVDSIRSGAAPVPFADLVATTTTTFAIGEALRSETSESVRHLDDLQARPSARWPISPSP